MKYLSFEGLTHFWDKVKTYVNGEVVEVQNALTADMAKKAPLASPTFTGTPKAPTAAKGTNTTQIATTEFVTSAIGEITFPDLSAYFNEVAYNSTSKNIEFKHGTTVVKTLSAAPFIKDGMVNAVSITTGTGANAGKQVLKVAFNTDAGQSPIEIPLEGIFNANNYYDKTEVDGLLAGYVETSVLEADYVKNSDLVAVTNAEIDALFNENA